MSLALAKADAIVSQRLEKKAKGGTNRNSDDKGEGEGGGGSVSTSETRTLLITSDQVVVHEGKGTEGRGGKGTLAAFNFNRRDAHHEGKRMFAAVVFPFCLFLKTNTLKKKKEGEKQPKRCEITVLGRERERERDSAFGCHSREARV